MNGEKLTPITNKPSLWALSPLLVFLCLYLVTSIIVDDFYKVPITVAFIDFLGICHLLNQRTEPERANVAVLHGAANKNIMLMIWIFILAGAFCPKCKRHRRHRCNC